MRTPHRRSILALALSAVIPGVSGLQAAQAPAGSPMEVDVQVHPRVGVRRIVIHADADGLASGFDVLRPGEREPLQRLPAQTGEPPPGGSLPRPVAEDLDGDGYLDLMLLSWWGATGNAGYLAWRYDPRTDRYVAIPGFEELSQPKVEPGGRCIRTRSNGGHLGNIHVLERWCWREGKLEIVWSQQQTNEGESNYLRVVRERRGGAMIETARKLMTPEALERERDEEDRRKKQRP